MLAQFFENIPGILSRPGALLTFVFSNTVRESENGRGQIPRFFF